MKKLVLRQIGMWMIGHTVVFLVELIQEVIDLE